MSHTVADVNHCRCSPACIDQCLISVYHLPCLLISDNFILKISILFIFGCFTLHVSGLHLAVLHHTSGLHLAVLSHVSGMYLTIYLMCRVCIWLFVEEAPLNHVQDT